MQQRISKQSDQVNRSQESEAQKLPGAEAEIDEVRQKIVQAQVAADDILASLFGPSIETEIIGEQRAQPERRAEDEAFLHAIRQEVGQ